MPPMLFRWTLVLVGEVWGVVGGVFIRDGSDEGIFVSMGIEVEVEVEMEVEGESVVVAVWTWK